jgi:hypothetical protein
MLAMDGWMALILQRLSVCPCKKCGKEGRKEEEDDRWHRSYRASSLPANLHNTLNGGYKFQMSNGRDRSHISR